MPRKTSKKSEMSNGSKVESVNDNVVKTFILDTNLIMRKPTCIYEFADKPGNKAIITSGVYEELDRNKSKPGSAGRNCHLFSYELLALQQRGPLREGIKTREGGIFQIYDKYRKDGRTNLNGLEVDLGQGDLDLISAAKHYQSTHPNEHVILVTSDKNVKVVATENGVRAEHRKAEEIDPRKLYKGYRLVDNESLMSKVYSSSKEPKSRLIKRKDLLDGGLDLASNEFVIFADSALREGVRKGTKIPELERIFRYNSELEVLRPINYHFQSVMGIKPRNLEQVLAFELMLDESVQIVPVIGEAGTGKTLIALAAAIYKTISRRKSMVEGEEWKYAGRAPTIFVTKRLKGVLDEEAGYLPGDEVDKNIDNYEGVDSAIEALACISKENYEVFKELGGTNLYDLVKAKNPILTILPLKKVRGMTSRQIILLEEGQNMEPFAIKTMVSRIGERSIFVTGDVTQSDNKDVHGYDGLTHLVNQVHACKDPRYTPILGTVTLVQNMRSKASEFASKYL